MLQRFCNAAKNPSAQIARCETRFDKMTRCKPLFYKGVLFITRIHNPEVPGSIPGIATI
jgi:hypothetical protein